MLKISLVKKLSKKQSSLEENKDCMINTSQLKNDSRLYTERGGHACNYDHYSHSNKKSSDVWIEADGIVGYRDE